MSASAEKNNESRSNYFAGVNNFDSDDVMTRRVSMFSSVSLWFTRSGRTLEINGHTTATDTMAEVGFKYLKVERSSDGINWATEIDLGDRLKYNNIIYSLYLPNITVTGGYFYRVRCSHYVKDLSTPAKAESFANETTSVWIS